MEQGEVSTDFSQMTDSSFKRISSLNIEYALHRIQIYGEEIWTAALHSGIVIFNSQCQEIQCLKNENLKFVCGLARLKNGELIVADTEKGLLHLDKNANYCRTIVDGRFSDVQIYKDKIYSLQWSGCIVHIHAYNSKNGEFSHVHQFKLKHTDGFWGDKLGVTDSHIYVGSWKNHCVYVYSVDGAFLYETGKRGCGDAGMLEHPYLCGVDASGSVLMCDWGNNRLQIHSSTRTTWYSLCIQDEGDLQRPISAAMDKQNLWVAKGKPFELIKYEMHPAG